jgi:hypothetical protein
LKHFFHLLEDNIDDFVQLIQMTMDPETYTFPGGSKPSVQLACLLRLLGMKVKTWSASRRRLKQGNGLGAICKQILGWVFDGAQRCIKLLLEKRSKRLQTTFID